MPRYIDADAKNLNPEALNGIDLDTAIEAIEAFLRSDECKYPLHIYLCAVRDFAEWYRDELKEAPTIDAVPVVRCGECKNFKLYPDREGTHYGQCLCWMVGGIGDDEYCSYGAKMEEVEP